MKQSLTGTTKLDNRCNLLNIIYPKNIFSIEELKNENCCDNWNSA
jgi:hypothetical protein